MLAFNYNIGPPHRGNAHSLGGGRKESFCRNHTNRPLEPVLTSWPGPAPQFRKMLAAFHPRCRFMCLLTGGRVDPVIIHAKNEVSAVLRPSTMASHDGWHCMAVGKTIPSQATSKGNCLRQKSTPRSLDLLAHSLPPPSSESSFLPQKSTPVPLDVLPG